MSPARICMAAPRFGAEEQAAVARVLESGQVAQGPEVAAFEAEFAEMVGVEHCVALNSGTSALHLGLLAAGIGAGDDVVLPSFTFAATANAVALTGATPVFVDVEPDTFCIDPAAIAAAVGPATAAIMPVHLYGQPADMDAIRAIAERHDLLVFEDAAQAHGARLGDRAVGAMGAAAAFSFYPTKNMTTGEGGMVSTDDGAVARRLRLLRNQGMEIRYQNEVVGFNNRMTDIAAAIGRVQLDRLAGFNDRRRAIAGTYDAALSSVSTPAIRPGAHHVYHQYTVLSDEREALRSRLTDADIGSDVYYPVPVHRLPSFGLELDLPVTEMLAARALSLPVHPQLADADVARVIEVIET